MINKKITLIAIFLFVLANISIYAQNSIVQLPKTIGIYGGLNLSMHTPSFNYPSSSGLILFDENNNTMGGHFGFVGFYPINETFVFSGRLGYNNLSGSFEKNRTIPDTLNIKFDATIATLEISPIIQFHNLLPIKEIYFLAGIEVGVPLSKKYSIDETKTISTSKQTLRLQPNSDIPFTSVRVAGALGAGYVWKATKSLYIMPEISYRVPFSSVSSDEKFKTWDIPQIRLGVNISFALTPTPEQKLPEPVSTLKVGFRNINYYDNDGNKHPLEKLKVEEVKYTELFPLVPYVFFEENDSVPSQKYQEMKAKTEAGVFTMQRLEPEAIKINSRTLDIVGTRMKENTISDLTITGTIDNKNETINTALSMRRAVQTKNYLATNYSINPDRINVRAVGLPDKPSTSNVPEGIQENRRIELTSSNKKILEPLVVEKDNQTIAEPNVIEVIPFAESTDSIINWTLELNQAGQTIRRFAGAGLPNPVQIVIIPNELTKSPIPLEYSFSAKNIKGITKSAVGTVPVDYFSYTRKKSEELPDKTISKYSLILFDFNKSEISAADLEIIEKHILPAIKFNSTIKIYGYTDNIGDESYNKKLAERRALSVKEFLEKKVKTAKYEDFGVGENEQIFDNNNPIGRQLSRTVQVYVITPK